MSKTLLLVDAFSVAYRAYFAMPYLTSPDGKPISVVFGFFNMLLKAYEAYKPSHILICFDHRSPTFRHKQYPAYKANRSEPEENFIVQVPILKESITQVGLIQDELEGFEADDLLGTYSFLAEQAHFNCLLLSSDQDCWQLISETTKTITSASKTGEWRETDPTILKENLGIEPQQIIDFKGLKGDASDNIPGVKGIGEKTASKLLSDYKSLENLYDKLDSISSKSVHEKLLAGTQNAFLSKNLATIIRNAPVTKELDQLEFKPKWNAFADLFETLAFHALKKKIPGFDSKNTSTPTKTPQQEHAQKGHYQVIDSAALLKPFCQLLKSGFAFDLETTSLNPIDAQIVGISISQGKKKAFYIPLNTYLTPPQGALFDIKETLLQAMNPILTLLKPLFEDEQAPKILHNSKYDMAILARYNIQLKGLAFDTYIAAHLLEKPKLGLKDLASSELGLAYDSFEDTLKTHQAKRFEELPLDIASEYACLDADATYRLYELFKEPIEQHFSELFYAIELKLVPILVGMEQKGVLIDTNHFKDLQQRFNQKIEFEKEAILKLAEEDFNINSTQQLAEILYTKLKLPISKKTKTGASTDSSVLKDLDHPIAKHLLEYRLYAKLLSTYVRALPKLIHPKTHRIHTQFNQCITKTGRLSSSNPNLQNIPIRSDSGSLIRAGFISQFPEGHIVSMDYSQIELRILAHFCEDPQLCKAFQNNVDIHAQTACQLFNTRLDTVDSKQRDIAKTVNFGITYGQGATALAAQLDIPRAEAQEIIQNYHTSFPSISAFISECIQKAKADGYVQTLFNRCRHLPDINSGNGGRRSFSERMAVNTTIQGSAAEIMKLGMLNVAKLLEGRKSHLLIQVHDELVFDISTDELDMIDALKEALENAYTLKVPLQVSIGSGFNWQDTK